MSGVRLRVRTDSSRRTRIRDHEPEVRPGEDDEPLGAAVLPASIDAAPLVPGPGTGEGGNGAWAEAIIASVNDIIAVVASDTTITWISPSTKARLGMEPCEMLGLSVLDLVHPDDVAEAAAKWDEVMGPTEVYPTTELRVRHRDGSYRYLNITGINLLDIPEVQGVVLSTVDVTERRLAEEALAQREQWAQALVQGGSELVVVVDDSGVLTYASPGVFAVLGRTPDEVVGQDLGGLIHPADFEFTSRLFLGEEVLSAGEGAEVRVRHRDGSYRILDLVMTDMRDNPAVAGVVVNVRDVTTRHFMESMLTEQAGLLEAIARGAPLELTLQKVAQMVEHSVAGVHAAIGTLEPDGIIRVRTAPDVPRDIVSALDVLDPGSQLGRNLRSGRAELFSYDIPADLAAGVPSSAEGFGYERLYQGAVLAPGTGELLGALSVFAPDRRVLGPLEHDVLQRALNLAAIAIERRRFERELEYNTQFDSLTGLPNRAMLHARIQDALDRARRLDTGVAVLLIDLDRFKVINESVGHAVGDELLRQVTERLHAQVRPGDTLGRFGGDEFVVVCNRVPNEVAAAAAADRMMEALQAPFPLGMGEIFVTASIGIAFTAGEVGDAEALTRHADVAMYRAKDQGRSQFVVFQDTVDLPAVEQLALEQALRQGIDEQQFELHFQPVVRLADGVMSKVECLVRWHRPGFGMVPPGEFIPVAEETGLIVPLGWWILDEACRLASTWPVLPTGGEVEVSVNLSARQLQSAALVPEVEATLERWGLDPSRLCLEITESALVHDIERAKTALEAVKALGVRVSIDDFGTGYASLDYLRHFTMADELKIDRAFVDGVEREGSQEAAIVAAAVALARSLGLATVAEGVETLFQVEALRGLECDSAQGFLFSRPVPLAEAIALIASQS
jgi:diguanylate cyclase (GGDEF)-like protein/PAS domain S-box-containing protein